MHWLVLAGIFGFLSMDEAASIHEALARLLRRLTGLGNLWLNAPLIGAVALAYRRFFFHLPGRTRGLFLAAGTSFFTGLFLLEKLGERFVAGSPGIYATLVVLEETAEMAGIAIFVYALLDYPRRHAPELAVRFE